MRSGTLTHGFFASYRRLYGEYHREDPKKSPTFRRHQLPDPTEYYAEHAGLVLNQRRGWVTLLCPLHDDTHPSLSVNLSTGGFICHACGAKGGDVLDFHRQRYSLSFTAAAQELGALS